MRIFTLTADDGTTRARNGRLDLPHGCIETPVFMPVGTNATVKAISHDALKEMNVGLILGNTYHLFLRPGLNIIKQAGGLHAFMGWDGNVLTDSGGYQVFSLASLRKITDTGAAFQSHIDGSRHLFTPENVVDAQAIFGSDIAMPLDVCTAPGITKAEAMEAVAITSDWLARSVHQWNSLRNGENGEWQGALFGIVQGNFFNDLRRQSAELTLAHNLPGTAIGGLSVGEEFSV